MDMQQRQLELAGPLPALAPSGRLRGRVCLVVGATSGIGRATALRMAEEGAAAVVVTGRRRELGLELEQEIRQRGADGLFLACDATRQEDMAAVVEQAVARFGRLDAAFNNAGFQERRAALAEQDDAVFSQVFDTNVRAVFHAMRHELAAMLATGGGTIVNNTSVSGIRNPNPGLSLYGASKAAALSLTRPWPRGHGHDAGLGHCRHACRGGGPAAAAHGPSAGGGHGRRLADVGRGGLCGRSLPGDRWRFPGRMSLPGASPLREASTTGFDMMTV